MDGFLSLWRTNHGPEPTHFSVHVDRSHADVYAASMSTSTYALSKTIGPISIPGGVSFQTLMAIPPLPFPLTPLSQLHKEVPMTEPKKKTTQDAVKEAGLLALKLEGARQTNKALTALLLDETGLSLKYPILATEKGRAAFQTLLPVMVHAAATNLPLPKADFVAAAAEASMTAGMQAGLAEVMGEAMELLLPLWGKIIAIFEKTAQLPQGEGPLSDATVGDPAEKARVVSGGA